MGNNTAIQLRNDTAANWTSDNPTLALGEMGLETDTQKIKFGDGTTVWNSLSYFGGNSSFKYGLYELSANQTSNLADGNHVEYDTTSGSLGGLSTGSGQANGIITLTGGKTYKITCELRLGFSGNTGITAMWIYDRTNSTMVRTSVFYAVTNGTNNSGSHVLWAIISPSTNIDIDIRIANPTALTSIASLYNFLLIEEYAGY